jgi:hypothetical protein
MPRYSLKFAAPQSADGADALDFDAEDASGALAIAQRHGDGRPAELWAGEKLVCRIAVDSEAGFWRIG